MHAKKRFSPRFAILFVLALAVVSAATFFVFTHYQRQMAEERRAFSASRLAHFRTLLNGYAQLHSGNLPEHAFVFLEHLDGKELIHPAWPEQAGYVYVGGAHSSTDNPASILIYENVPERKRKLGFQVLRLDGRVDWLSQQDFVSALQAQEAAWKKKGRVWQPEEIVPPPKGKMEPSDR